MIQTCHSLFQFYFSEFAEVFERKNVSIRFLSLKMILYESLEFAKSIILHMGNKQLRTALFTDMI